MNHAASASYRAAAELGGDRPPEAVGCRYCGEDHAERACCHLSADGRGRRHDPLRALMRRADAVAARFDAFVAAGHPEPHIAANHTCTDGGLCLPCAEHDAQLIEIEAQERQRSRTR